MRIQYTLWIAVLAGVACGCGASRATVAVTRLGTVPPRANHPAVLARHQARTAAKALEKTLDILQEQVDLSHNSGLKKTIRDDHAKASAINAELAEPTPISLTTARAKELAAISAKLPDCSVLGIFLDSNMKVTWNGRELNRTEWIKEVEKQKQIAGDLAQQSVETAQKAAVLCYGGYVDQTVYRIDAADNAWAQLKPLPSGPETQKLTFNGIGESGVLIVQDSPANLHFKAISTDPTESMRNTLIVANQLISLVNSYLPMMGSPRINSITAQPAAGRPAVPLAPANPTLQASQSAIGDLLDNTRFKELLAKARGGIATGSEKAEILNQVRAAIPVAEPITKPVK